MPCASSTWLGSLSPLAQALPAATAKPAWSSDSTSRSERMPSASSNEWPGRRSASAETGVRPPPTRRSSRSRSARRRSLRPRAAASAAANPTTPATFSVPLREPPSWPPPQISGRSREGSRAISAPTPFGPVHLVRRQRHRLGAGGREVHRQRRRRLHRVGVQRHAPLGADRSQLRDRLHDARDVVRPHHRRHPVTRPHRPVERVRGRSHPTDRPPPRPPQSPVAPAPGQAP